MSYLLILPFLLLISYFSFSFISPTTIKTWGRGKEFYIKISFTYFIFYLSVVLRAASLSLLSCLLLSLSHHLYISYHFWAAVENIKNGSFPPHFFLLLSLNFHQAPPKKPCCVHCWCCYCLSLLARLSLSFLRETVSKFFSLHHIVVKTLQDNVSCDRGGILLIKVWSLSLFWKGGGRERRSHQIIFNIVFQSALTVLNFWHGFLLPYFVLVSLV